MADVSALLLLLLLVAIIVAAAFWVITPSSTLSSRVNRSVSNSWSRSATSSSGDFEALLSLILLAAMGAAIYQFVKSGGLKRLLELVGELPIEVDGRRTTIASAVVDHADIAQLLREAITVKLSALDRQALLAANVDKTSFTTANAVADMLRDTLAARMRQRGI
jgi:hypothetical protein